jgi:DNA-binding transcriptional LysR family regulator
MVHMTETQLRSFVAVAEHRSFGEASRRLHLTQPGVSRAVQSLEDELGGPLFVRAHGTVTLTQLGERALVRSRAMLAEADAMRQELDEQRGIASGRVRLGSMPSGAAALVGARNGTDAVAGVRDVSDRRDRTDDPP